MDKVILVAAIPLLLLLNSARTFRSVAFFLDNYGLSGLIVCVFGSREVWRVQVQILGSTRDSEAMDFKRSAQDDSNIIAVASTILAQVAITALSLNDLSRAHWIARAFFTFSLVSSIMAVYYATSQYRTLGRCLRAEQVKRWILGSGSVREGNVQFLLGTHPDMPSAAAVLNMSAPNMLLSSSLNAFLIGLGVYLGYVWTRNLDEQAGVTGSRAVFITYIAGLIVCYLVYALSRAVVADQTYVSEREWLRKHITTDPHRYTSALEGFADLCIRAVQMHRAMRGAMKGTPTQRPPDTDVERATTTASIPTHIDPDVESTTSLKVITESSSGNAGRKSGIHDEDTRRELLVLFQEAADMRKASAKVDERLAQLLERLGEETVR